MPLELQYELELIGDFIHSQNHLKSNMKLSDRRSNVIEYRNRILIFPVLGTVTVKDYDLPLMPPPQLVNVESVRFDYKNSIRNSDRKEGK